MVKKYNLKCFGCGYKFKDKSEVHRDGLKQPLCEECYGEFQCNQAQMEVERYHDEKEAKKYREAMDRYEKAKEKWDLKYQEAEQKRKETGEPIPKEIWDWMPQKPLNQDERELKRYYINRYGEW